MVEPPHRRTASDELVYVLSGEVTLVTDSGEEVLHAGDAAGFPANDSNGAVSPIAERYCRQSAITATST